MFLSKNSNETCKGIQLTIQKKKSGNVSNRFDKKIVVLIIIFHSIEMYYSKSTENFFIIVPLSFQDKGKLKIGSIIL